MVEKTNLLDMAVHISSAYVSNNPIAADELHGFIRSVHSTLVDIYTGAPTPAASPPAVSPKRSVTSQYLVCLEDGKRFKSLKRHLQAHHGMTPAEYREKWGLPRDYPMVASAYAQTRSRLARENGLGKKRRSRRG